MGGVDDRICCFVYRGLWRSCMVHCMGEATWVRPVCGVPDHRGWRCLGLGIETGGVGDCAERNLRLLTGCRARSPSGTSARRRILEANKGDWKIANQRFKLV